MENGVRGRRILITGGSSGIGRASALLLAARGATIVIVGRDKEELDETVREITVAGGNALGISADVTHDEDVEQVFQNVTRRFGGLDVLINNAGVGGGSLFEKDLNKTKEMIATNLTAYLAFVKKSVPFLDQTDGHIINIGSLSAEHLEEGIEVYVATKAAVRGFTHSLRKTANKKRIKVTLIEPGSVGTNMQPQDPTKQADLQKKMKMLKAEDIAEVVYFILSQPLRVDIISIQVKPSRQFI